MPSLIVHDSERGKTRVVSLFKRITTLGASGENDVVLRGPNIEEHHAQVVFDGRQFTVSAATKRAVLHINGKKKKAGSLDDGDSIQVGESMIKFSLYDDQPSNAPQDQSDSVEVLGRLVSFSTRLMEMRDIGPLLQQLLDDVIDVTNADKGFLVLTDGDDVRVQVARNLAGDDLGTSDTALSDSIVRKVLDTREALIVSDALNDSEFSSSASVVNLRLCSVLATPLIARGELLGLIYLGNDNVVNLFTESTLELMRIYGAQAATIVRNALLLNELVDKTQALEEKLEALRFGEIIGACNSMREIYRKIEKLAKTDISVLVGGETGTGKELIAQEIHARSPRANGPFVVINCGAIPENLLESELFGHVRGAFTGAVATQQGKFQAANKGTLFLDELGEMPLNLQVKLLRAIQDRRVTKVGETKAEDVDIRIIAATNKNLADEVRGGRFREDLYYRLNVVALILPPLRDRGEDVVLLGRYYLQRYAKELGSSARDFSKESIRGLRKHSWPGNIRELQNRIKKAAVFAEGTRVQPADLGLDEEMVKKVLPLSDAKDEFQRRYIDRVLEMNDGNRTKTARDLEVDPRTIFRHLEKKRGDDGEPNADAGEIFDPVLDN